MTEKKRRVDIDQMARAVSHRIERQENEKWINETLGLIERLLSPDAEDITFNNLEERKEMALVLLKDALSNR